MTRRKQSPVASIALLVLLSLTLFYGCRAFDPEPVIVNRPPDTFMIGAPAETTGARYQRHLYWYGSDRDGEVVRFIYAITDSTVRDVRNPDVDEEDDRFNPAIDVTTLENTDERFVGWTTKTDSIFTFLVDREETPSKDITFHIVAIDDRGAVDPTPARLRFFNNSLGNPKIRFRVFIDQRASGSSTADWVLRWVGLSEASLPDLSPEATERPFVGFGRRFKIEWEASSPNGEILGYRFKAAQGSGSFTPADLGGEKQWDPTLTEFIFNNDTPPSTFGTVCDTFTAAGCPPDEVRFNSGNYLLSVKAIDRILVESEAVDGELTYEINYPPETRVTRDAQFPYFFRSFDDYGNDALRVPFATGDTIPTGVYVVMKRSGFDRIPAFAGAEFDSFCCDKILNPAVPEVRFQTRLRLSGDEGGRILRFQNTFSAPDESDTIGFVSGPFQFAVDSRTVDEHRRPDPSPDDFEFFAGFPPLVTEIEPAAGDTLLLRSPTATPWPENDVPYTTEPATRYWDGIQYLSEPGDGRTEVRGTVYRFFPRFVGAPDPREAGGNSSVRAWAYALNSTRDPSNVIGDGPGESPDLTFFNTSPAPNVWDFGPDPEEGFEIFIDNLFWTLPQFFEPGSDNQTREQIGRDLRRYLGPVQFRVVARTTAPGDKVPLFANTRPGPDEPVQQEISTERLGRRSEVRVENFHVFLGIEDPTNPGQVSRYWPDF